jgi:hypothetical protein
MAGIPRVVANFSPALLSTGATGKPELEKNSSAAAAEANVAPATKSSWRRGLAERAAAACAQRGKPSGSRIVVKCWEQRSHPFTCCSTLAGTGEPAARQSKT